MTDREKEVIKGLEICSAGEWNSTGGRDHTNCPYYPAGYTGCTCKLLMRDALSLLLDREPQVMAISEVERVGADNHSAFKNDGLTVMWLEEFGKQYPLHVVVLKWDEDDWQGEPNNIVNVYYFGTDEFDQFSLTDYNKTWRCWTDKPTKTQRMGAAWYA